MIRFRLDQPPTSIVCVGAHPDDIEIGAAGALVRCADWYPEAEFHFIILTGDGERRAEATLSAAALLGDHVTVHFGGFDDRFLPYRDAGAAKAFVASSVNAESSDLVFAPHRDDLHQDHRFAADLVRQTFRHHPVFGYEIHKSEGDLGRPNFYVPLTAEQVEAKVGHLKAHFASQQSKPWYDGEAFQALMRIRGIESTTESGYAEAFHVGKIVLGD